MEVGAVGDGRGDSAAEGEGREGELVDATVVAGDALEVGSEAVARGGEGGLRPVAEANGGIRQRAAEIGEAGLVIWIGERRRRTEQEEGENQRKEISRRW